MIISENEMNNPEMSNNAGSGNNLSKFSNLIQNQNKMFNFREQEKDKSMR